MTIGELLSRAAITIDPGPLSQDVLHATSSGVFYDSRVVVPGGVFVAIVGEHLNGTTFADDARSRGAALVLAEEDSPALTRQPWIRVPDARAALAALAAAFYGNPSHSLSVVGVTGTNGKTTTTYLIESIFQHAGIKSGRMSSIANRVAADQPEQRAVRTTPEAPDLHAWLKLMRDREIRACVMEVSSHALALRRVDQVRFAGGVFTNLSRDHLDFHGDMGSYFGAKARLFEMLPAGAPAMLNVDDARGREIEKMVTRPVTYGLNRPADVTATRLDFGLDGTRMEARTPRGTLHLESPLIGRIAAYNLMAAVATSVAFDVSFRGIEEGVRALVGVPGRMQTVTGSKDDVTVIVDFAHTDDALRGLLDAVRPLTQGNVFTVFGCGGDRDATKRPLMGAVAARMSDRVFLTSDNPRSEEPVDIIADIERGLTNVQVPSVVIPDREEAITRAIREAVAGDLVVIAGKGHERYQEIGTRTVPFDDGAVARVALSKRCSSSRVG